MRIPYQQQVCGRCGCLPAFPTAVCPVCGTPLAPPRPGQRPEPLLLPGVPCAPVPRPDSAPLTVELVLNVLGIYGVGWLMLGKTPIGLPLLIGSLVLWPVVATMTIMTMGLGLLCIALPAIGAIVFNLLLLRRASTHHGGRAW